MRSVYAASLQSATSHGTVGPQGARIMVVEDDGVLALHLAETLDELGYTVAGTRRAAKKQLSWLDACIRT